MKHIRYSHCLVGVAAAAALLLVFGVQPVTILTLLVVLACPLLMVLMMHSMESGGHPSQSGDSEGTDSVPTR